MREILFRGKRTDNGEWIEGYLVKIGRESFSDHERYGICNKAIPLGGSGVCYNLKIDEVIPETVGQYTGLTDKNGKKIFEGDIIFCKKPIEGNHIDYCIEFGFVEMKYGAFGLHRKQGFYRPFKDWLEDYEYEVIGNIHDNPEFMEEDA